MNRFEEPKRTIAQWKEEIAIIENEWTKKIEEINEDFSEQRLFALERIAELKGEPIL